MNQRPRFHFVPPTGWVNDPNGLIYWQGQYHLFYQWNPLETRWRNIHWGHAVSSDLLHWQNLPAALSPSDDFDSSGCWSGCAVADGDQLKLIYTAARNYNPQTDSADIQIRMASSQDGIHFAKHPKPLIDWPWGSAIGGHKLCGFRDPVVWPEGKGWKMIVGAGIEGQGGAALLFESADLETWRFIDLLASGDQNRIEPIWTGSVWECPQLLDFGSAQALSMSVWYQHKGYYTAYLAGEYDGRNLKVSSGEKLDYGDAYYAPQAFRDKQGNWVQLGWIWDRRSEQERLESGWAGLISLPRQLQWRDGRLWQTSVALELNRREVSLETLHHDALQINLSLSEGQVVRLVGADSDKDWLELSLQGDSFQLQRPQHPPLVMPITGSELELFWDRGVLEVFASGRAMTLQVGWGSISIHNPQVQKGAAWALSNGG